MLHPLLPLLFLALGLPAHATPQWFLFARDDGCVDLQLLVRMEKLARAPASPEDFAQMLRDRGETVSLALPAGFPAELAGKVVQVSYRPERAPVFVTAEVCRQRMDGR